MSTNQNQNNELKQVFAFIKKYRLRLITVTLICAILSGAISMLIPKEYKSLAIAFPPGSITLDQNSENPNFGYDIEADRLLQILQSTEIRDSVIKKFNLIEYYSIDSTDQDWLSKLTLKYQKDIEFKRTTFMSIVISCQTKDAELSAAIVNHILYMADKVREKIYKQNVKLAYTKASDEFQIEKRITDSLFLVLQGEIKNLNISGLILLAPNAQLNFDLAQLAKGKNEGVENLNIGADILKYRYHLDRQNDVEVRMKRIGKTLDNPIAKIHILDAAEPNYKKTYPLVTLNVLVSAILGFLFASLYFIVQSKSN